MIIKPQKHLALDCYVDADFAGLYGTEDGLDPICAKRRTGYVITLGETPVHWVSRLQTKIALSTTESEYVALATSMRDVLPLRRLIQEFADKLLRAWFTIFFHCFCQYLNFKLDHL
jgi:hypothetical protein